MQRPEGADPVPRRVTDRLAARARQLKHETYALYLAARHPRTPWYARAWTILVVAYALSPIDLIPDFVPVLGYLDDVILVPLGLVVALRLIPAEVMVECREKAVLVDGIPGGKRAAAVVVIIWLAAVMLAGWWLWTLFGRRS